MPVKTPRSVLEDALVACKNDQDEFCQVIPDEDMSAHLKAASYLYEASEQIDKKKVVRMETLRMAIERAKHDEMVELFKSKSPASA